MSTVSIRAAGSSGVLGSDALGALLWVAVVVPPSFGFWLVAGDLAGVPAGDERTLILSSLLALGFATLVQVLAGYRMPIFEGPASTYLGAVAVLAAGAGGTHPAQVTAGLLAAGVFVFLLGIFNFDRVLLRIFRPAVVVSFVLIVAIAVAPDTIERAIGRDGSHSWGSSAAWISSAVVVACAVGGRRIAPLRSFGLLIGLVAGTLCYFLLAGFPSQAIESSWALPTLFPWGAPDFSAAAVIPFLIAGVLASLNLMASIDAVAVATGDRPAVATTRRAIACHGGSQAVAACFGNVLGNVPRLDSAAVVRMIGNPRPRALAIAAAAIFALAFLSPVVDLLSRIPISVSAAVLGVVLAMLAEQGLRQMKGFEWWRRWLVVVPAVAPTFAWLIFADRLSEQLQLVANPLLIGVVLAVVLDRLVPRLLAGQARGAIG
ncbi:MAG TPA: solute carrier family 23 protein [Solirubrobacterales bacterium]